MGMRQLRGCVGVLEIERRSHVHECTAPFDVSLAEDEVTQTIKPSAFYLHKSLPYRPRPPTSHHPPRHRPSPAFLCNPAAAPCLRLFHQ
jgi:hypothetical protein